MKTSFRVWLQEIWMQHREEVEMWTNCSPDYDLRMYFNKHKWWLKSQFKKQLDTQ